MVEDRRRADVAKGGGSRRLQERRVAAVALCVVTLALVGVAVPGQSLARCARCQGAAALNVTVVIDEPPVSLFAQQNESISRGATVAVAEIDAQRGSRVHFRLVGKNLDALSAVAVQAQLRAVDATALILPCDTDSEYQLVAKIAKYHTLMLAPCDPDPSAGVRYPTYWGVGVGGNAEAAALVTFMESLGFHRPFIVNGSGARYMGLLTGFFRTAAVGAGLKLTGSATVSITKPDYSAVVKAVKAAVPHPGLIFTALPPPYVNRLAAALKAALPTGLDNVPIDLFGTTAMDTPLTITKNPAPYGAIFTSYGYLSGGAAAQQFAKDYHKTFHTTVVGGFPGLGLDTIRLLAEAVERANSVSPAAINKALSRGLTLSGVGLGDRTYTADGDHSPLAQVGISKVDPPGSLNPLTAILPSNVPLP